MRNSFRIQRIVCQVSHFSRSNRLWSCDAIESNWKIVLSVVCHHWDTIDVGANIRCCGTTHGASQLVAWCTQLKTRPSISTIPLATFASGYCRSHRRHIVSDNPNVRVWLLGRHLGCNGCILLLLYIAHNNRPGWLHTGRRSRPKISIILQNSHDRLFDFR